MSIASALSELEESGDYRVLKRHVPQQQYAVDSGARKISGAFIDVETTGLKPTQDKIIELAIVRFSFCKSGHLYDVDDGVSYLEDPGMPIPPEATDVNGIRDEDVAGKRIDDDRVV